jgi:hypothetical protein
MVPNGASCIVQSLATQAMKTNAAIPTMEWVPFRWPPEIFPIPAQMMLDSGASE